MVQIGHTVKELHARMPAIQKGFNVRWMVATVFRPTCCVNITLSHKQVNCKVLFQRSYFSLKYVGTLLQADVKHSLHLVWNPLVLLFVSKC